MNEETRAEARAANHHQVTQPASSIPRGTGFSAHDTGSDRHCSKKLQASEGGIPARIRRRRWQLEHDVLHGRTYPTCPSKPSTFLLEPAELRREANRLHASGWRRDEIVQVLDLEPVVK